MLVISSCPVWRVESGWNRGGGGAKSGGSEPSGQGEQLAWGMSLQEKRLRESTYALPSPHPHHPTCPQWSGDIEAPSASIPSSSLTLQLPGLLWLPKQ